VTASHCHGVHGPVDVVESMSIAVSSIFAQPGTPARAREERIIFDAPQRR
jgi:hypothetical protein